MFLSAVYIFFSVSLQSTIFRKVSMEPTAIHLEANRLIEVHSYTSSVSTTRNTATAPTKASGTPPTAPSNVDEPPPAPAPFSTQSSGSSSTECADCTKKLEEQKNQQQQEMMREMRLYREKKDKEYEKKEKELELERASIAESRVELKEALTVDPVPHTRPAIYSSSPPQQQFE
jgi:hypothetical protein